MSYEIEKGKYAFKYKDKYNEDCFLCWIKIGSNNIIPRSYKPYFLIADDEYQVIKKVLDLCKDVVGGCLKPYGKWITPESYLKSWREVLKNADDFEDFKKLYPNAILKFSIDKKSLKRIDKLKTKVYAIEDLRKLLSKATQEQNKRYKENWDIIFKLDNTEVFKSIQQFISLIKYLNIKTSYQDLSLNGF